MAVLKQVFGARKFIINFIVKSSKLLRKILCKLAVSRIVVITHEFT